MQFHCLYIVAEKPKNVVEDSVAAQDKTEEKKEELRPEEEVVRKSSRPLSPKRSQIYTIDPAIPIELDIGLEGISATEPLAIGHLLQRTKKKFPEYLAMANKNGESWKIVTYSEYYDLCIRAAKSFLKVNHRACILCPTFSFSPLSLLLCLSLSVFLSLSVSVCLFVTLYLSLSLCLSRCLSL